MDMTDFEIESDEPDDTVATSIIATVVSTAIDAAVLELVTRGREHGGSLTSGEVFAALRDLQPDTGQLAAIYSAIESAGVSVHDEIRDELEYEDRQRAEEESARRRGVEHHRTPPTSPVVRPGDASDGGRRNNFGAEFSPTSGRTHGEG